jgi:hypothetical protein
MEIDQDVCQRTGRGRGAGGRDPAYAAAAPLGRDRRVKEPLGKAVLEGARQARGGGHSPDSGQEGAFRTQVRET